MSKKKSRKAQPKLKRPNDDPAQSTRFVEAAKAAEADDSPDALDRALDHVTLIPRK